MSYHSGSSIINGSVEMVTEQVLATISGTANNATTTLGTVPANKRWRIVSARLQGLVGTTGGSQQVLAHTRVLLWSNLGGATVQTTVPPQSIKWDWNIQPIITAGQTVTLVCTGANNYGWAVVDYVEESV